MPSASRRKAKKLKTLTILNHHSSPADQLQGAAVSSNHSKKMEGSLNGTLQNTQNEETQSLSQDKEVAVEVDEETPQTPSEELVESSKVEETQEDVTESVAETFESDAVKDAQDESSKELESDTVELELKEQQEEKEKDLAPSEDNNNNNEASSVSGNEGLGETEVVETVVKDMEVGEEEENVLSSVVTVKLQEETSEVFGDSSLPPTGDVVSEETVETSVAKSDESDKIVAPTIIEKSLDLEPTLDEKVGEPSGGQEESSNESAKETSQPSPSVPEAESTENQTIGPVTQSENSSWKSCCGLLEIVMGGSR
ncbi:uncharacterized protein LOC109819149 [Cajanus cajan]|uniref:uncharacterized protein LOC109819149 n=1 Tax=Cajanus cajan TaxID=3821 RepID=UPI00098DBA02|nr:uncharacterized protein LOC109819149 [Cajanus cajan]